MHEHRDIDGNVTGSTVVTRESLWSDEARARALGLQQYEDSICGCGCNLPMAQAHRQQPFLVDHYRCYAGMAKEAGKKKHRADAEAEAKKNRTELPDNWETGLHYYVTLPDPS